MESPESLCRAGNPLIPSEKCHADSKSVDVFVVDDLLDFSNEEEATDDDEPYAANSTDSSAVTVIDSCCNSSFSGSEQNFSGDRSSDVLTDAHFSGDLCVPCEDIAELEWLSNFVEEESFSSEDMRKLQLISGMKARTDSDASEFTGGNSRNNPILRPDVSVPGKARSKRSRASPSTWSSRMLVSSESESGKKSAPRKRDASEDGRKCLHCATEKTPQWRTGPMGPKTLCNACGVRYKSGRLVPEYRPAASPTFVLSKHSNSHRKVMELRRHKFLHPDAILDDYLIHHQII